VRPPAARPRSGNSPFRLHQKADGITARAAGKAVIFVAIDVERPAGMIPSGRSPATWCAGTYPDGSQPMPVHSLSSWRWQRGLVRQRPLRSAPARRMRQEAWSSSESSGSWRVAVRWNLSSRLDVLGFKHHQIVAAPHTAPDTPADPTARPRRRRHGPDRRRRAGCAPWRCQRGGRGACRHRAAHERGRRRRHLSQRDGVWTGLTSAV
jgi:hypothetical protein